MLSKEDYKNYVNQIVEIEEKMSILYRECAERLEDESIRGVCAGLSAAEQRHGQMVKELRDLFDF